MASQREANTIIPRLPSSAFASSMAFPSCLG